MKYSLYQNKTEIKLYIQTQKGLVKGYQFFSNIENISNIPGMTRLFGAETEMDNDYPLYPIDYSIASVGKFDLIEQTEKFTRLNFEKEEKAVLQGEWLLRHLSTGETLFWKPYPTVGVMSTKNIDISQKDGEVIKTVDQQFSVFAIEAFENTFSGIAAAEGVWTGADFRTTLFTDEIIQKLAKDMKNNMSTQLVDFNHDFIPAGKLTNVELRKERGISYIFVEGITERPVAFGAGLSILIKSTLKWNSKLNVYVLLEASSLGTSIITESKPACTMCMIR